ncbi:hypothetical protein ODR38_02120, partial [Pediococcus acidilactici]
ARRTFSQVVGEYYGHRYFGEAAFFDVHEMVVAMINVYEKRLANNDWLFFNCSLAPSRLFIGSLS